MYIEDNPFIFCSMLLNYFISKSFFCLFNRKIENMDNVELSKNNLSDTVVEPSSVDPHTEDELVPGNVNLAEEEEKRLLWKIDL